jgi:hypothetical protein
LPRIIHPVCPADRPRASFENEGEKLTVDVGHVMKGSDDDPTRGVLPA